MNRKVTLLRGAAEPTATELADRTALRGLLREHFGFDLPEVESVAVPAIPEWT
jgi:N-hydroxyarylamine O-acetyltransferase